ncbi:HTTM domain-containing protein [Haloechinothrix salitolerans]|uniref:HTTM domain-containing protein n=1 Tax=Haloechinothrix salitolerans TaxID=926830 RepID=A0ABW2C656_9PSEU
MSEKQGWDAALVRGYERITRSALGTYQTAVVRIGVAGTWLGFLLREWPNRHELYGPEGPLSADLAAKRIEDNGAFTVLLWSDTVWWFELCYIFAILASLMLLVGWRTRTASVLFMVGVLSVQNRNGFISDGGDNILHLMAIYLVFVRCGERFSLDALLRRRAGGSPRDVTGVLLWSLSAFATVTAWALGVLGGGWLLIFAGLLVAHAVWWLVDRLTGGEPRAVLRMTTNLVHNGAVLVIIVQVCVLYATAGWFKIQGTRWQDGTAAYFPLHVDVFTPWPALSELVSAYGLPILLMTYGTVIVQVAFPFTLFHRGIKNVMLACLIAEHIGIAILLGLPFFSLAIISADLIFLPTTLLRRVAAQVGGWFGGRAARRGAETPAASSGDAIDADDSAAANDDSRTETLDRV